jgi:hypothetical protein
MRLDIGHGKSIPLDFGSIQPGDRIRWDDMPLTVTVMPYDTTDACVYAVDDMDNQQLVPEEDIIVMGLADLLRKEA